MKAKEKRNLTVSDSAGPAALALLVFAGQLKENPLLQWVPVDLTLLSASMVVLLSAHSRLRRGPTQGNLGWVITLWALFLLGVFGSPLEGYAETKVLTLFTITLALAVAPFYLLRTNHQRLWFVSSLVIIGIFTAVNVLFLEPTTTEWTNRVVLEGSNTIATAQMAGVGALVAAVYAFRPGARFFHRLFLLGLMAAFLYVILSTGSRGPFVALAVALIATVLASPGLRRFRGRAILGTVVTASAVMWWASKEESDGFRRIMALLSGEGDDSSYQRTVIWGESWDIISTRFFGIGWGDFSGYFGAISYPHNLFLEVFVEAGWIVGVAVLVYVLWSVTRLGRLSVTPVTVAMFALLAFTVVSAMVSSDINGNRLMWVLLSMAWVSRANADDAPTPVLHTPKRGSRSPSRLRSINY